MYTFNVTDGMIHGGLTVTDEMRFGGLIDGNVTVRPGGNFILGGIVTGDLTVEPGGELTVHGMVKGNIRNLGGKVNVTGIVDGHILTN